MRNQYKVLQEKYELEVEARTPEKKAIYNTKALTQDFTPTAIKIYRTQVEPIIRSWPDFDIMTDVKFPYNILEDIKRGAYWAHLYLYKSQDFPRDNVDAILERWFVHHLFEKVYKGYQEKLPRNFYRDKQIGRIPPLKSNADFIQYLIKLAMARMKLTYETNHRRAEEEGESLKKFRAIKAAQTQHTKTHGIDLRDW